MVQEKQKEVKEEPKVSSERYQLVEVPTQTGIFIRDNNSNEVLDDKTVLLEILNKLNSLTKALA